MNILRLHLLSFPHTQTTRDYLTCAYTQKVVKFAKMMHGRGHQVFLYSGEQNDAPCTEHIQCVSEKERLGWFGDNDQNRMPEVGWEATQPYWRIYSSQAIIEITKRVQRGDFILLGTSWPLKPVADAFANETISVEHGIGYEGAICDDKIHGCYESYAWMHHVYGIKQLKNGRNFDCVIPNYFDPDDFPQCNDGKGDYLLYVGRVTPRKGIEECVEIAKASRTRLIIAGPRGATKTQDEVKIHDSNVEFVGAVNAEQRAKLMAGAKALLAPTRYIEPFGGVTAEAMMCGTPVITTDFGAFTETVLQGYTGFRIHTLNEAVNAVGLLDTLDHAEIRKYAMERFSLEAVAPQYEAWFTRLQTLWGKGWYELGEQS